MAIKAGSFTKGSTGNVTIDTGFQPLFLRFTVSQLYSGPENTQAHLSTGSTDGVTQSSHSILMINDNDTFGNYTRNYSIYCVSHMALVSNSITRVISASFVSFNATSFTLNFDRATTDYQIFFEAYS